ncbi:hypothetical protein ACH5RR_017341 [Cinchona calisaya]|uniref:Autophagy-related protein 13 N-terminal domain-containing protein n=1 Tax=Cinchona calisaya TaxID=153742 RepID=A0ABD3A245_9GENT
MDLHGNPQGEYGRFEQIRTQFLLKSLHIVLDSRVPSIQPHSRHREVRKSDRWFNLVLGDRPSALYNLHFWHRNLMDPMIIDIIIVQETPNSPFQHSLRATSGLGTFTETVIERWVVQYEYLRAMVPQTSDVSYKKTYKKSIILLRSLFSMMRLLPAYKAFRKLSSSSQTCDFEINYKVSTFTAPFSRTEEELMKHYSFIPVDAQQGRFAISVTYRENLSDFNLEASTPLPPEIIADYVGSPLTDPLRAFPSSLEKGFHATSLLSRGKQSPSSVPFQRPHSWTSGLHRGVSSPHSQPLAGSPPLYRAPCEYSSSPSDIYGRKVQDIRSLAHHKAASFDDYHLSPPFSPSPSPSPPTYVSSGNSLQTRLRSESAPVSIPHPIVARSSRYLSPNLSDPNRNSLPPLSPRYTKQDSSSQESPSGTKSVRKPDSLRSGESSYGMTNLGQKVSRDAKDDSGRFSGLLSSSGSPRVGFSRSSSRLSFQDDLDEGDFSCPFIVDDVDTSDSPANQNLDFRKGSEASSQANSSVRKSRDAAVGALVHMLRTAPPLRQDSSGFASRSEKSEFESNVGAGSGFFLPRKTSDALEELKPYKEMKELLLSKSATRKLSKEEASSS